MGGNERHRLYVRALRPVLAVQQILGRFPAVLALSRQILQVHMGLPPASDRRRPAQVFQAEPVESADVVIALNDVAFAFWLLQQPADGTFTCAGLL